MNCVIKVQKSKKGNNYICLSVGDTVIFLDDIQLMKILKMNPYELALVKSQEGFIYDILNERRVD